MAPHFLQRLELDATADERAIRRAYAQKLKKIDQEAEPAAFQELRSAYDMALRWARRPSKIEPARDAELAGANLEAAPPLEIAHSYVPRNVAVPKLRAAAPAVGAPVLGEDASALATAAYAKFMSRFEAAAADPGAIPDAKVWQASLEEVIAGEELVSMTAREIFERKFANLLAQGWKPGHEALFVSAANVFRWDEDRRHLQSFGHVGFVLERALQERASFHRQKPEYRAQQRTVIVRLRNPAEPSRDELSSSFALLENVVRNFPTWLGIITDVSKLPRWRELHAELPQHKQARPISNGQLPVPPAPSKSWNGLWVVLLLVVLANMGRFLSNGPASQPTVFPSQSTTSGQLFAPTETPATQPTALLGAAPAGLTSIPPAPKPQLSQKAVAALVKKAPSPEVCDEVFRISQVHGLGTPQQDADPGPGFDRQIVACVAKRYWPTSLGSDASVEQALRRERARLAENNKKLRAQMDKIYLEPTNPPPPSPVTRPLRGVFTSPDISATNSGQINNESRER